MEDYDKLGGAAGEIPAYLGTYSSVMLEKQVCHADGTGVPCR